MITIFPEKDEVYKQKVLSHTKFDGEKQYVLTVKDNNSKIGYISLDLYKRKLCILDIYIDNKYKSLKNQSEICEIADSIIRSAASFALNRKIFVLFSKNSNLFELLEKFGFTRYGDLVQSDLSKILSKCKKCGNV